jgi:hypothetical protein
MSKKINLTELYESMEESRMDKALASVKKAKPRKTQTTSKPKKEK